MNAPVTLSNVSRKNFLAYRLYSQCSLANHDGQGHSPRCTCSSWVGYGSHPWLYLDACQLAVMM